MIFIIEERNMILTILLILLIGLSVFAVISFNKDSNFEYKNNIYYDSTQT